MNKVLYMLTTDESVNVWDDSEVIIHVIIHKWETVTTSCDAQETEKIIHGLLWDECLILT